MRFLLELKHWQLFSLTWGIATLITGISFFKDPHLFELFPVMMLVLTAGFFGWIWAIAVTLHQQLPPHVPLNLAYFKILILIPVLYSIGIIIWVSSIAYTGNPALDLSMKFKIGLLLIFHLISMVCIVLSIRFAAKTLRSIELGRHARFNDYVGEFFLIWFSIIGIWIIQPKLNKLIKE